MKTKQAFSKMGLLLLALTFTITSCGDEPAADSTTDKPLVRKSLNEKIDKLDIAIQATADNPDLYVQRAAEYWAVQGYDEALTDMEKAVELAPDNPDYYHILADYYMDYFRSRQAMKTMETAGLKFPDRIPTLLKLAEYYLILKNQPAAHRTLDRIAELEPLNAEMFYMRGLVYEDEDKIPDAISAFRFATENNSDMIEAYLKLGDLTAEQEPKTALQFYNNATRINPENVDALMSKAYHLSNVMNDLPTAQETYREIHRIDPQNKTAWHNSGLLYMDMDSLEQARRQFTFAIKASPTAVESYYYRGISSEMSGDVSAAKDDYEQVTRMNPSFKAGKEAYERVNKMVAQ